MAYRLKRSESVETGVRRIAAEQIGRALAEIEDPALGPHVTVHQVRKRCKKLRGLVRLARPALGEDVYAYENAWFRDTGRLLSDARDAAVLCETLAEVTKDDASVESGDAVGALRAQLERRRDAAASLAAGTGSGEPLDRVRRRLEEGRERAYGWSLDASGFDAVAPGLRRTYRRGRNAMAAAYEDASPESFHEWRKRAKYGLYHVRLLRNLWKRELRASRDAYDELSDRLGNDHDLAVLRRAVSRRETGLADVDPDEVEAVLAAIDRRRDALEASARPLGARIYSEKPKHLRRRLGAYWDVWREGRAQDL